MRTGLLMAAALLAACEEGERLEPMAAEEPAPVVPAAEALAGVHVPTLDPARLSGVEIEAALGAGAACVFRYTEGSGPVLALAARPGAEAAGGVVKLGGGLVLLEPAEAETPAVALAAGEARAALAPLPEEGQAEMRFEVGRELQAGYRGYSDCFG